MGSDIMLTAADGFEFSAYRADPDGTPRGGIVVVQEIFGVNEHIRDVTDRFAAEGYVAIAPAIFDRQGPGFEVGYDTDGVASAKARVGQGNFDDFLRDIAATRDALKPIGPVGIVGYCLGGSLAFAAATRFGGFSAAVGYYGGRIHSSRSEEPRCPVQLHFGTEDASIPMNEVEEVVAMRPEVEVHIHEAGHGFNCDLRASYSPDAAASAWASTLGFFGDYLSAAQT
jgi:carboxymethylenebutenolidase